VVEHDPHAQRQQHARRHERPEDWGWHGEFGRWARVAGWLSAGLLVALNFTFHYSGVETVWLLGIAAVMVTMLIWDWYRRKNAWRA
jgi:Protein of unknown function (DUF2631)